MMRIIGTRGSGKTSNLLKLAAENKGTFVTHFPPYAKQLAEQIGDEVKDVPIISYAEFEQRSRYRKEKGSFFIDEIDGFLRYIHPNIRGYTLGLETSDDTVELEVYE